MSERVIPGIQRLREVERRTRYEVDRTVQDTAQKPVLSTAGKPVNGYMWLETQQRNRVTRPGVEAFVEREAAERTKRNNFWAEWHIQQDGRLSKNQPHRVEMLAEKIIGDFAKNK